MAMPMTGATCYVWLYSCLHRYVGTRLRQQLVPGCQPRLASHTVHRPCLLPAPFGKRHLHDPRLYPLTCCLSESEVVTPLLVMSSAPGITVISPRMR